MNIAHADFITTVTDADTRALALRHKVIEAGAALTDIFTAHIKKTPIGGHAGALDRNHRLGLELVQNSHAFPFGIIQITYSQLHGVIFILDRAKQRIATDQDWLGV